MNLLTSDRIFGKKYRGSGPVSFEHPVCRILIIHCIETVLSRVPLGCHIERLLNPLACEGHNSFVEKNIIIWCPRIYFDHSIYYRNCIFPSERINCQIQTLSHIPRTPEFVYLLLFFRAVSCFGPGDFGFLF